MKSPKSKREKEFKGLSECMSAAAAAIELNL